MKNKSNSKYKICFLTSTYLPSIGGAQIGLHTIATGLSNRGNKVCIVIPFLTFLKFKFKGWKTNYSILPFPPKIFRLYYNYPKLFISTIKIYLKLINIIYKIDFWIANLAYPSGVILSKISKDKVFKNNAVLCPGDDIQIQSNISYGIRLDKKIDFEIKTYLKNLKNFISLTESVKKEYLKIGIKENKIIEIPYGVNESNLILNYNKKLLRNKFKISQDTHIFLCVGRNHPKKNFKLFIKIVENLNLRKNYNYKILIVGKDLEKMNGIAIEKKIENNFIFLNEISNSQENQLSFPSTKLSEIYNLSDCFIFPSDLETFGIVLVEAMIAKLPIITTNAPGCRDVVKSNRDGMVFERGDFVKAADFMEKIITNLNIKDEFSFKSFKRSKFFYIDNIANKYEDLILSSIKQL